ncbi:E3 ubiquitin-protein ligase CCNB1IP1 isoform X4 [Erinaceus europaeus]|uniref:E3 ubiquitin-protein ligase CCNB1IP1 isoform X4 n=1 Tax=Erinaceus europaeus TaxID=9365 RepID=A0ABM3W481_ERIEU|nr:E3 ubiquitin-protein ligase CCNB1IP1 isoform X4 [Erinaceus europaeus]
MGLRTECSSSLSVYVPWEGLRLGPSSGPNRALPEPGEVSSQRTGLRARADWAGDAAGPQPVPADASSTGAWNRLTASKVHQERLYQEYNFSKAEGHLKQMEKIYTQQIQSKDVELTSMKGEVTSMKKVLEEYKKKFSDISEKLMERNRQYQKLQGLYDSLRLRNITIANQEGNVDSTMFTQSGVFGFPVGNNSSKFALDATPVRNQGGGDGDFQFRPFFVGSPAAPEPSNSFFSFASPNRELEQHQNPSRAFKVKRI